MLACRLLWSCYIIDVYISIADMLVGYDSKLDHLILVYCFERKSINRLQEIIRHCANFVICTGYFSSGLPPLHLWIKTPLFLVMGCFSLN